MSSDAPLFEVTDETADLEARRLVTAAYVAATMGSPPATAVLEAYIDEVSAKMARFAKLAADTAGTPPTFGLESCKATWRAGGCGRGDRLLLPFRTPISEVTVTECGVELTAADDYLLMPGAILERVSGCWSSGAIIVEYDGGWELPDDCPPDLAAACAEQVKYRALMINVNPAVRSIAVPDIYSASYSVPGGDGIGPSGLLIQVEDALAPYRSLR